MLRHPWVFVLGFVLLRAGAYAQSPVEYRLTFPDYVHHVMDVDVTFSDVPSGPLEIQMSRSSPGRYALHEFVKNVFDVRLVDGSGHALAAEQPDLHRWTVDARGGQVRMQYRVFGDRIDGTYFAVDATLAHINAPATLVWARGLETRPARVTLTQPPGATWTVATQLYTTSDPLTFTAPNLQYLMDSPLQFAPQTVRSFTVSAPGAGAADATIRLALHHEGTEDEAHAYLLDLERVVREQQAIFGELPRFDAGVYTFLASYVPSANGDGMEHRNSTVITSAGSIRSNRSGLLGTASHEFFHAWNVERIRPRSLEPFDFTKANVSGELWLAEGFTSYYGPLTLLRAGLTPFDQAVREWEGLVNAVSLTPGRRSRSAVDMSRLAPFVDASCSVDVTNWENTYLSYYTFGAALGLGLDLSLRDLTDGRVSLDDYMRAMWTRYGKGVSEPGYVASPYTIADARATLADVSGDRAFAEQFFARFIEGHEVLDYARLLARAGLLLRPVRPGRAWMGDLAIDTGTHGSRVAASPRMGTPAYEAGLGEGDLLISLAGMQISSSADLDRALEQHRPGDTVAAIASRAGREITLQIALRADPRQEIATVESTGAALTSEQRRFRDAWIRSRVR
jgi:predicted metalloprotease with PDZ domain